jgi:WD40 repeat protein
VFVLAAHRAAVTCVSLDGAGSLLVSGSHDESLRVWSADERKIKQVLDTHQTHRLKLQEVRQQSRRRR